MSTWGHENDNRGMSQQYRIVTAVGGSCRLEYPWYLDTQPFSGELSLCGQHVIWVTPQGRLGWERNLTKTQLEKASHSVIRYPQEDRGGRTRHPKSLNEDGRKWTVTRVREELPGMIAPMCAGPTEYSPFFSKQCFSMHSSTIH